MDFVLDNRSRTASSSALAKFARPRSVLPGADLAGGDEDGVVEMLRKLRHSVLFGKLPDVLENINDPVSLGHGSSGVHAVHVTALPQSGAWLELTNIDPSEMAGARIGKVLILFKSLAQEERRARSASTKRP